MLTFEDTLDELEGRQPSRMVPDLDRIRALAELLGHPERTYPSIHVTGTNGKTTTSRLITRILCAHGLSAGVYTSPHLASVTERFALCDQEISEQEFTETYRHLEPYLREVDARGDERVTYFEVLTALAYLWFADKPVDAAVFEVGMGGEWDATNLIESAVAVFCSIDVDHPELGSTVEEHAREKAGIIKPGTAVILQDPGEVERRVIRKRADEVAAPVVLAGGGYALEGRIVAVGGQQLRVRGIHETYDDLVLPLHGLHQAENAATAVAAAETFLGRALDHDGLAEAFAGATSPGRLEIVARHPLVVLDGAHNPDAARRLAEALPEAFVWRRLHLVVGVLATKDVMGILAPLAARTTVAYACANSNPHSLPPERMLAACETAGMTAVEVPSVHDALDSAEADADEDDVIVVTGSLYTVADARPRYVKD